MVVPQLTLNQSSCTSLGQMKKDLLGTVWQKRSSNQTSYTPMGIPKSPTKSVLKSFGKRMEQVTYLKPPLHPQRPSRTFTTWRATSVDPCPTCWFQRPRAGRTTCRIWWPFRLRKTHRACGRWSKLGKNGCMISAVRNPEMTREGIVSNSGWDHWTISLRHLSKLNAPAHGERLNARWLERVSLWMVHPKIYSNLWSWAL